MKYSNVNERFESIAATYPEQVAIIDGNQSYTYENINAQANQLARLLQSWGENLGNVGVIFSGSANLVKSLLAIFKAEGVYLPMSLDFSNKRLQQILQQCMPEIILVAHQDFDLIKERLYNAAYNPTHIIVLNTEGAVEVYDNVDGQWCPVGYESYESTNLQKTPKDASANHSYIFYTSGSTGQAKAILGSHKGLSHFIDWEIDEFGVKPGYRVSQLIHPVFDASLRDIFVPLCAGATLCIPESETFQNTENLVKWLSDSQISMIHCVPSLLRLMMDSMDDAMEGLDALKYVLVSGEPLYVKDVKKWRSKAGEQSQLVNLYGTTETTLIKTFYRVKEVQGDDNQVIPVGKPISKTVVAVINNQHLCGAGEIGEVYIKTPFWSEGYLFDSELNKQVFVQNPLIKDREDIVYKTGDLGRYLKSGDLEIRGRLDHQVKVNGIRVELGEIEKSLMNIEGIKQALVIDHINNRGDVELIAYYTGEEKKPETIRESITAEINKNIIPGYIQYINEFPLTITGKVDRKSLPKPAQLWEKEHAYVPVQNEIEEKLEIMWRHILDVEKIGRSVSFFSIGGTSLKAIQLISRIFKEFGTLIKVVDIFANPTIEKLAAIIENSPKKDYEEIVPVQQATRYEATHQQKRLWVLDQLEKGQVAYNMPYAFELKGKIDQEALSNAWKAVVERHESLRTTFSWDKGKLYQHIADAHSFFFKPAFKDISRHEHAEEVAHKMLQDVSKHQFRLDEGPLFYTHLIQVAEEHYFLFLNAHHIIADAWSMHVMARDLLAFYRSFILKDANQPAPLKIHYKDYGAWVNQRLKAQESKDEQYWLAQFNDDLPLLNLPTDFQRPEKQTFVGQKYHYQFDTELSRKIQTYCKEHDFSLFMLLLAAVDVVLYYYSGQKDIIIGIPVTGRHHQSLENQIGFYVNTLALRLQSKVDTPLVDLIKEVKQKLLKAQEHGIYPIDKLVEKLGKGADRNRSGLFDVMVQIQDTDVKELELQLPDNISMEAVDLNIQSSKFDLVFNFEALKEAKTISGWIEYNAALFLEKRVIQMQQVLIAVLKEIITEVPGEITLKTLKKHLNDLFKDDVILEKGSFTDLQISEDF
jgi:amino acid adenylation domain-containing protein